MSKHLRAERPSPFARLLRVLPYVGIVVSIIILAAPAVADYVDSLRASDRISVLSSTLEALPAAEKERLLTQAQRYNERLAGVGASVLDEADGSEADGSGGADGAIGSDAEDKILPYEEQLCVDSTSMMGWVEIPSIEVKLPVYHGTDVAELAVGVGHLQGSSLPVGGPSTHCVLTAHSGMQGSRMFDDIRLLEKGDVFVLWALGDPHAYEVTGSEVVLPDETSSLCVRKGEDLCTLITCTPYGVNSHRILVHARRCDYQPENEEPARVTSRVLPIVLAVAGIALVAVLVAVVRVVRRKRAA